MADTDNCFRCGKRFRNGDSASFVNDENGNRRLQCTDKARCGNQHKHDYELLKKFRWLGTDNYILVNGCVECGDVRAGTVGIKWIPASRREIDEANRVASALEEYAK